jgi:hypothetical protein
MTIVISVLWPYFSGGGEETQEWGERDREREREIWDRKRPGGKKEKKGDLRGKTDERKMRRKEEECREKIKEEKKTERGERGQKGLADEEGGDGEGGGVKMEDRGGTWKGRTE